MKKITTILFAVVTVAVLGVLLLFYAQSFGSTGATATADLTIRFYGAEGMDHQGNLTVWTNNSGKWSYTTAPSADGNTTWVFKNISSTSNVYDQMMAAAQIANFTIQIQEYPGMGKIVLTVDGVDNLEFEGRAWQFYVDGVYGVKASNLSAIESGSSVEWRYIPNQSK